MSVKAAWNKNCHIEFKSNHSLNSFDNSHLTSSPFFNTTEYFHSSQGQVISTENTASGGSYYASELFSKTFNSTLTSLASTSSLDVKALTFPLSSLPYFLFYTPRRLFNYGPFRCSAPYVSVNSNWVHPPGNPRGLAQKHCPGGRDLTFESCPEAGNSIRAGILWKFKVKHFVRVLVLSVINTGCSKSC